MGKFKMGLALCVPYHSTLQSADALSRVFMLQILLDRSPVMRFPSMENSTVLKERKTGE